MPTIKATTPEELKAQFVLWARQHSYQYGSAAKLSSHKTLMKEYLTKSNTYSFIADYWEKMELNPIESKRKKMCPDSQKECEENCSQNDCHLKLSKAGLFDMDGD